MTGNIPCRCEHCGCEFDASPSNGHHRVVCGDSTDRRIIDLALGGDKPSECLTDPPYGIGDSHTKKNKYLDYDDSEESLKSLIDLLMPILESSSRRIVLTPGIKNQYLWPVPTWVMAWFYPGGVGRGPWGFCCWQPILCYGSDPRLVKGHGSYPDAIVLTETSEKTAHPCSKPVNFWAWLVDRTSDVGDVILDPFIGSGTALISAEMKGRFVRGVEITPEYVDICVSRWIRYTGGLAAHAETGEIFPVQGSTST